MWPIRLFAAVLLLPLAALAARTADGIARVVVARLRGAPPPPVRDAAGLASPDTIGPMGSDVSFIAYGAYRGEMEEIFSKTVRICLECICIG